MPYVIAITPSLSFVPGSKPYIARVTITLPSQSMKCGTNPGLAFDFRDPSRKLLGDFLDHGWGIEDYRARRHGEEARFDTLSEAVNWLRSTMTEAEAVIEAVYQSNARVAQELIEARASIPCVQLEYDFLCL